MPPFTVDIALLLGSSETIAVVGLSDKPGRDSFRVSAYMQRQGYGIVPVNPQVLEVLGQKAYASLRDVPVHLDIVNVFRRPEAVPEIVEEAITVGAKAIWLQLGIVHQEAANAARRAGLQVVMDHCIMVEHARLNARGR
jgi:predicted CoA-binding protein